MAEAFLKKYGDDLFESESAGIRAGTINPDVVQVMLEIGIDLRASALLSALDLALTGHHYDAIIAVCDRESVKGCPQFPGAIVSLSWPFEDPATFPGSPEDVLVRVRRLRDQIRQKVIDFIRQASHPDYWVRPSVPGK